MPQLLANIIYLASTIFLAGISFSLIFSTARFFHFAHAGIITAGAYGAFTCSRVLLLPMPVAIVVGVTVAAALGLGIESAVYRPMRRKRTSPLVLLLASLGIYIVLQNTISLLFGDDTKILADSAMPASLSLLGARLTSVQLATITLAAIVFIAKVCVLDRSKVGLALRAIADSPELARVSGIRFDLTMGVAFCLGSALGGLAGVLRAFDVGMTPTMGLPMLLLGVVAVVLGGNRKTVGLAASSLLLAAAQQAAGWVLGTHWKETAAFLVLLAFLLWRPEGFRAISAAKATLEPTR